MKALRRGPQEHLSWKKKKERILVTKKSLGEKKTKEGAQLLKIPRICSGTRTWKRVNLSFMKVREA